MTQILDHVVVVHILNLRQEKVSLKLTNIVIQLQRLRFLLTPGSQVLGGLIPALKLQKRRPNYIFAPCALLSILPPQTINLLHMANILLDMATMIYPQLYITSIHTKFRLTQLDACEWPQQQLSAALNCTSTRVN